MLMFLAFTKIKYVICRFRYLPPTGKITYVNMWIEYVDMQHDCVDIQYNHQTEYKFSEIQ